MFICKVFFFRFVFFVEMRHGKICLSKQIFHFSLIQSLNFNRVPLKIPSKKEYKSIAWFFFYYKLQFIFLVCFVFVFQLQSWNSLTNIYIRKRLDVSAISGFLKKKTQTQTNFQFQGKKTYKMSRITTKHNRALQFSMYYFLFSIQFLKSQFQVASFQ